MGERARENLATNNLGAVERFATDLIAKHGLADVIDAQDRARVEQAILRAGCDYTESMKARFEGDFNYERRDALLRMSLDQPPPSPAPMVQSSADLSPLFSTAAKAFREHQLRRKVWENQTALQSRKTYELFVEICGDRPLASYVRKDATNFKNTLERLPANYGKAVDATPWDRTAAKGQLRCQTPRGMSVIAAAVIASGQSGHGP